MQPITQHPFYRTLQPSTNTLQEHSTPLLPSTDFPSSSASLDFHSTYDEENHPNLDTAGDLDSPPDLDSATFKTSLIAAKAPPPSPPTSRRKKALICSGIFLLFLAITLPIAALVGGPAIAASTLNKSQVSFEAMYMTAPSATDYKFSVAADVLVNHVSPIGGTIQAMDVDLIYNEQVLGKLKMPDMTVEAFKDNHKVVPSQVFTVTNERLWDEFR